MTDKNTDASNWNANKGRDHVSCVDVSPIRPFASNSKNGSGNPIKSCDRKNMDKTKLSKSRNPKAGNHGDKHKNDKGPSHDFMDSIPFSAKKYTNCQKKGWNNTNCM